MKNSLPEKPDQSTPEMIEDAPESAKRNLPDLTALIEQTKEMVEKHEQVNSEEIGTRVDQLRTAIAKLVYLKDIRAKRIDRIKGIKNPYAALSITEELTEELRNEYVRLGLLTREESGQLAKIEVLLDAIEKIKKPTAEIKQRQLELVEAESRLLSIISIGIQFAKTAFEDRRDRVWNRTLDHYNKRAGITGQLIHDLKSDPLVAERFEAEETLNLAIRNLASATDRQKYAIENLSKAMKSDRVKTVLLGIFDSSGKEQRQHVYRLRSDLVKAVKDGRISDPAQVAPWRTKTGKKYESVIAALKDRKFLDKLREVASAEMMETLQDVVDIDTALRILYGRETEGMGFDKNRKRIKKQKSEFWKAFEQKK